MCDVAAIGPAVSAIGSAAGVSQENAEKRRAYNHKMKVRERKWMRDRTTYKTKKVQFEQEVDYAAIAAQRAYTRTNIQLNRARAMAIIQNQGDFQKMLQNQGNIMVRAAERGITGKSLAKLLVTNQGNFGMTQAMRSRQLAAADYQAKEVKADVNRQLKTKMNQAFSKVALNPIPDIAPPPPVMGSPGMALMLGMGQALGAGLEAQNAKNFQKKLHNNPTQNSVDSGISFDNTYGTGIPSGDALTQGMFSYTPGYQGYD